MFTRTKIICTIGPAVSEYGKICELIEAGMDVARINFSHGTHEQHQNIIELLKKARKDKGVPLAIILDTKGPEIRLGMIKDNYLQVNEGQKLLLVKKEVEGTAKRVTLTPGHVIDDLRPEMQVLFDDGCISAECIDVTEEGAIVCFKDAGVLKSQKGVNIPHGGISLPAVTKQDISDIVFGCKQDVDIIAASFIRSAEHIVTIKRLLADNNRSDIMVIAKIENAEGVKNFDSIVQVADGIMIARGDLGVELPLTQVPSLQKMMIKKCYELFKPVVTATQMLESMIYNPRPTRAEVSDVANAIYDSTSCVMLSGETAVGKYPIDTVKMMKSTISEAEKEFKYIEFFYTDMASKRYNDVSSSVALATVKTAYTAEGKAIFVFTSSGFTARAMARFRPKMPIIAVTPKEKIYHQLAFEWGVVPIRGEVKNVEEGIQVASCYGMKEGLVQYGDLIIVSCGTPFGISGTTNMMMVDNIGDVLVRGIPGKGRRVHGQVKIILNVEPTKHYLTKNQIVVISQCDETYHPILEQARGIILQNHPEDTESEKDAKRLAKQRHIPLITRADGALTLLSEGQMITLDANKGLVFKGVVESEDQMVAQVCEKT